MGTSFPLLKQLLQKQMQNNGAIGVASRQRALRKAFVVWTMIALSVIFVTNQIRATKEMALLFRKNEPSTLFLPDWGIHSSSSSSSNSSSSSSSSGLLSSWLWWLEEDEDDESRSLDGDDNVYEDDENHEVTDDTLDDTEKTLQNLNNKLRTLRLQLAEYNNLHQGKLEPALMAKYQNLIRVKRQLIKDNRKQEKQQHYFDRVFNRSQEDAAYLAERLERAPNNKEYQWDPNQEELFELQVQREEALAERMRRNRRKSEALFWQPPGINTTDYTKYPILPMEDRVLPHMSETGGVVFFLHVPKTGGQTIRQLNRRFRRHLERTEKREMLQRAIKREEKRHFNPHGYDSLPQTPFDAKRPIPEELELDHLSASHMRYLLANTLRTFRQAVPRINSQLMGNSSDPRNILFVEVHGMDNYNAFELEPYLQYWREQSKKTGVPFFAFTILREALSLQTSFFNFYYIHPGDPRFCKNPLKPQQKCGQGPTMAGMPGHDPRGPRTSRHIRGAVGRHFAPKQEKITHENGMEDMTHEQLEAAMLKVAYENPQCLFLARGERTFGDDPDAAAQRQGLGRNECQSAYMSLQRTMDWIGKTDTMSTETLPLLMDLMFQKPSLAAHLQKANVSPQEGGWVKLAKASQSTIKRLERLSELDQEMYYRVNEDYTMDQWTNHVGIDQ